MKLSRRLALLLSALLVGFFFIAFDVLLGHWSDGREALGNSNSNVKINNNKIDNNKIDNNNINSNVIIINNNSNNSNNATSINSHHHSVGIVKSSHKEMIENKQLNPPQQSKFAYITLLSGIDPSLKYRGFLYNALIMKNSLLKFGSTADFMVLLGFRTEDIAFFESDLALLRKFGIIPVLLPRWTDTSHPLSFAEMALLKITPWSMIHYDKIQFLDGDVMPTKNLDCYFQLNHNAFTVGAVSPLNSGWYLAKPNLKHFEYLRERAIWRLGRDWDKVNGWGVPMPRGVYYRGGEQLCKEWEFNGCDMDQGLLFHFFVLNNGDALLIDSHLRSAKEFKDGDGYLRQLKERGAGPEPQPVRAVLSGCDARDPTQLFVHYTGRSKPWMQDLNNLSPAKKDDQFRLWCANLDGLKIPSVDCKAVADLKYGAPLGFFNANFPKGGFKTVSKTPRVV